MENGEDLIKGILYENFFLLLFFLKSKLIIKLI